MGTTNHTIMPKAKESKGKINEISIILPDIRSAYNVGSIFRTADAAGVTKIYLTGYTPCPIDKYGRPQKEIAKTALGGEQTIPWEYHTSVTILLRKLKAQEATIVAVEQAQNSVDYRIIKKNVKTGEPIVLIFGNEVDGLPKSVLQKADLIAEIPMKGEKESLNVSVTAGIVLFELLK